MSKGVFGSLILAALTLALAGRPFTLFAGVQNLTNRRNLAGFTWNRRTNSQQVSKQDK